VANLLNKLDRCAETGDSFNLKIVFAFYSQDTNGELSFSTQSRTQEYGDPSLLPPNNDHILLSKILGFTVRLKPVLVRYGPLMPWPYLRHLLESRVVVRMEAQRSKRAEFEKRRRYKDAADIYSKMSAIMRMMMTKGTSIY